jgi:hypothetical protein
MAFGSAAPFKWPTIRYSGSPQWKAKFVGGMSGSPIISAEGAAIGVACLGAEDGAGNQAECSGPNPSLLGNLPGWLLRGGTGAARTTPKPRPA